MYTSLLFWLLGTQEYILHNESNIIITESHAHILNDILQYQSVILNSSANIEINSNITWTNNLTNLTIIAGSNIVLNASIHASGLCTLKAGMIYRSSQLIFTVPTHKIYTHNQVVIYYTPVHPHSSEDQDNIYSNHIVPYHALLSFTLIWTLDDLLHITHNLHGNYALACDIIVNQEINPIDQDTKFFSGIFDGNDKTIRNANIKHNDYDVGLFRVIEGYSSTKPAIIKNLILYNITVQGILRVGALAGTTIYTNIINVKVYNSTLNGNFMVGSIVGSMESSQMINSHTLHSTTTALYHKGNLVGGMRYSSIKPMNHNDVAYIVPHEDI